MRINKSIIEKLNPCRDRFDNFLEHYSDFDSDLKDFIILDKISYSDKVWVVTRLFTKEQNVKWAILCASKVLSIFEKEYTNDKRPRLAIEAAVNWLSNPTEENQHAAAAAAESAWSAAWSAAESAARSADLSARSAAESARSAAESAWSAAESAWSAAESAARSADLSARSAAESAAESADKQKDLNLKLMLECL